MISWGDYSSWFRSQYVLLTPELLEPGSIECNNGPTLGATSQPRQAPWIVDWAVIFKDGKYFRVKESFRRLGYPNSGYGERQHFSYHYGLAHPTLDSAGFPGTDGPSIPNADLRIDLDKNRKPHIHINSPAHIEQHRVQGYSIKDADMIQFLKAVIEHRKSNVALRQLLNIRVLP
jgi:hypothetical protein